MAKGEKMLLSVFIYNMAWEAGIPAAGVVASCDTDLTLRTHAHTHTHVQTYASVQAAHSVCEIPAEHTHTDIKSPVFAPKPQP